MKYNINEATTPEVLLRIMEECAETIQECSKALRFGLDGHHPDKPNETNYNRIMREFDDTMKCVEELEKRWKNR